VSNTPILLEVSSLTSTMLAPLPSLPTLMPSVDGNLYDQAVAVIGLVVVSITCTRLLPVSST
jgi:di/tricarboxylate transporter